MKNPTINPDEMLKSMAAEAVKQHKQIRTTIRDLTLEALQMRELSLKQINSVVRKVTEGVNVGVGGGKIDVEKALSDALAGMDEALLKVVEANKVALQKLTEGGASFEESSVKKGLKELEAFEEKFLAGVKQAAQEASDRTRAMEIHSRQHPARWNRHRRAGEGDAQCARSGSAGCHAFVARGWIEGHAHAHAELCHARERSADRPVGGA